MQNDFYVMNISGNFMCPLSSYSRIQRIICECYFRYIPMSKNQAVKRVFASKGEDEIVIDI